MQLEKKSKVYSTNKQRNQRNDRITDLLDFVIDTNKNIGSAYIYEYICEYTRKKFTLNVQKFEVGNRIFRNKPSKKRFNALK